MTAEQVRLVRDLRSFESPVCMEAAREIERLVVKLTIAVADRGAAEREAERLQNQIFALDSELEQPA